MLSLVLWRIRVTLNDNRQLVGQMLAFDRHMNLVLADCEEFRRIKQKKKANTEDDSAPSQELKRSLGLVILRGEMIVSLSVEGPPPQVDDDKKTAGLLPGPGRGGPAGRGMGMLPPIGAMPPGMGRGVPFAPPPGMPGLPGAPPPGFRPPGAPMGFPPGMPPPPPGLTSSSLSILSGQQADLTMLQLPIQLPSGPNETPLVTVSKTHEHVWVIELHNGVDNRITEDMCVRALGPALILVESQWRDNHWRKAYEDKTDGEKKIASGALIIIANRKQQKFFSNGFDFPKLLKKPHFIPNSYDPILKHLLGFPIPVIAAINGHAFAAGFMLALACDYRIMKSQKAWLSMNEILFGGPIPRSFSTLFNAKCTDAMVVRKVFLEAHRFTAQEALQVKLVDELVEGDSDAVFAAAVKLALGVSHLSRLGVYGLIKKEVYNRTLQGISENETVRIVHPPEEDEEFQRKVKSRL
ncbi:hypothetical protein FRC17_000165 [Serendipita sp. 399]|nr:hypothetical protein FRC17_000165 [Serendipita sp. 399]